LFQGLSFFINPLEVRCSEVTTSPTSPPGAMSTASASNSARPGGISWPGKSGDFQVIIGTIQLPGETKYLRQNSG
ncbi:MAG: hypothetical protein JJU29_22700, partial [Verrucomicrobia bacterium]|nr:hypothetical protein [Verrucomicrobiota bacterium]